MPTPSLSATAEAASPTLQLPSSPSSGTSFVGEEMGLGPRGTLLPEAAGTQHPPGSVLSQAEGAHSLSLPLVSFSGCLQGLAY